MYIYIHIHIYMFIHIYLYISMYFHTLWTSLSWRGLHLRLANHLVLPPIQFLPG